MTRPATTVSRRDAIYTNHAATTNPEGAGTIEGAGEYAIGLTATLTATANDGYHFLNWTLDGEAVSTNATYQFTVNDGANYVADFNHVHTQALTVG